MLAGEIDDFHRIPHDVILTNSLEPECLHTDGAATDFRVPKKESWRECLAFDLGPAGRVDEENEHVLLTAVQAARPIHPRLRRLKVRRKLFHDRQQIQVMEPGVARSVE